MVHTLKRNGENAFFKRLTAFLEDAERLFQFHHYRLYKTGQLIMNNVYKHG